MGKLRLDMDRLKFQAMASGRIYCVAYVLFQDTVLDPVMDRVSDLVGDCVLVPATVQR